MAATYTYSASRGSDLDRARELLGGTKVADATASDPGEALQAEMRQIQDAINETVIQIAGVQGELKMAATLSAHSDAPAG